VPIKPPQETVRTERADLPTAAIQAELEKILASKVFARSDRLRRFLRYVAEQVLQGNTEKLKEYVLGLEVFDRLDSYDQRLDPIVRVEARRLRTKLQDYYRMEGSADPICIELPERGYAPTFRRNETPAREAATQQEPSAIAVLPFVNMSSDPDNEYFSDGLTEELISTLAKIASLRVVARTSVFQFKGKASDLRYIGAQLQVTTVLEGSVRREGDRVRVTAQLINVADGYHLWSDTYERETKKVFAVQEEISKAIADALKARLSVDPHISVTRHPEDVEAYNLYLKARYYLNLRSEVGFLRSLDFFRKAVVKNPSYALAYAGLADAYSLSTRYHVAPAQEAWPKAKAAALKAVELDDTLAEAHTALAFVKLHYDWDWSGAEHEFRKALDINPSYAAAHQWNTWALAVRGRFEEAIASMKMACSLDPLSHNVSADLALAYYFSRQYEDAVQQCQEVLDLQPGFHRAHQLMGMVYIQQGLYPEAVAELQQAAVTSDRNRKVLGFLGFAEVMCGRRSDAERVLVELQGGERPYVSGVDLALIYSALGDRDRTFEWLEKAYDEHDGELIWLGVDPIYDRVREDPRFRSLLERLRLLSASR
jgi:TolB-like protein/Flp pilus assembly protein TadD